MANLPEGARVLYRKLSFKSKLGFGKYFDLSVEDVMTIDRDFYLVWVYYNMSNIDFLPDVKAALGIKYDVAKPGVELETYEIVKKELIEKQREEYKKTWDGLSEDEKRLRAYKIATIKKMKARRAVKKADIRDEHLCSKARLQAINHGRRK